LWIDRASVQTNAVDFGTDRIALSKHFDGEFLVIRDFLPTDVCHFHLTSCIVYFAGIPFRYLATHARLLSLGRRNEYWRRFRPLLGKKQQVMRKSRPLPRLLAYWPSRLKALAAVIGASHPADVGRMLA